MAGQTLKVHGLVLRKTKLGETDLIVSLLAEDGSLFQLVAKGARKPKSTFASRLELFSDVDVMCALGKGLPIAQEVRLVEGFPRLREDYLSTVCASAIAELLARCAQPELPMPRLFALSRASFEALSSASADSTEIVCVAALIKIFAVNGLRPSFIQCASCGREAALVGPDNCWHFSYEDGGVLCDSCRQFGSTVLISAQDLRWLHALLMSTFAQIATFELPSAFASFGLQFCQQWCRFHVGSQLKSLTFLLQGDASASLE